MNPMITLLDESTHPEVHRVILYKMNLPMTIEDKSTEDKSTKNASCSIIEEKSVDNHINESTDPEVPRVILWKKNQ